MTSQHNLKTTFFNPIMPSGADPWVLQKDGFYYYTHTTGKNITVWKSESLTSIGHGESRIVWTPPESGPNSKNIWAPELHWLNGRWYIYFAADDGNNDNHRMYVLESVSEDALGEYAEKGKISDPSDKWAIDGTVLQKEDGSLYFIWSGWEGDVNVSQNIYIAPMSNPYTIAGHRTEISRPVHDWERVGNPTVNEGPQILIKGQRIFLVYSASGSWTDHYCLGMLTTDMNSDVMQPGSWKKADSPVFSSANGVFGPGHNSFTRSVDGAEDWIVYHAAKFSGAGWNRNVRMQRFTWNADGTPNFGAPLSTSEEIAMPSGEAAMKRNHNHN
jgi:GH43 family beta-xylosidase